MPIPRNESATKHCCGNDGATAGHKLRHPPGCKYCQNPSTRSWYSSSTICCHSVSFAFSLTLTWLALSPPGHPQSGRGFSVFFLSQSYLGPREWSPLARWTFREFNEVRRLSARGSNGSLPKSRPWAQRVFREKGAQYTWTATRCVRVVVPVVVGS